MPCVEVFEWYGLYTALALYCTKGLVYIYIYTSEAAARVKSFFG